MKIVRDEIETNINTNNETTVATANTITDITTDTDIKSDVESTIPVVNQLVNENLNGYLEWNQLPGAKLYPVPKVFYRSMSYGEMLTLAKSNKTVSELYSLLSRLIKGINILDLALIDLKLIAGIIASSTTSTKIWSVTTKCPNCDHENTHNINFTELEYNEYKISKEDQSKTNQYSNCNVTTINGDTVLLELSPVVFRKYIEYQHFIEMKESESESKTESETESNEDDTKPLSDYIPSLLTFTMYIRNMDIQSAYDLLYDLTPESASRLVTLEESLNIDIKDIDTVCENEECKYNYKVVVPLKLKDYLPSEGFSEFVETKLSL